MVKYTQNIKANVVLRKRITPPLWGGWVGLLLFLLSSCVKDEIYNTDHPDKARVTVNTDWSDRGVDKPSSYIVAAKDVKEEATTDVYTISALLNPGNYTFYLYNQITQIPVTDGVAKVNTISGEQESSGIYIEPLPGWLFTGTMESGLEEDNEYTFPVTMHQQVRQLTLLLEVEGGMVADITAIKAYMTGVAGELNISNNIHSEVSNVTLSFTEITEGNDAGKWTATVRLLGITGIEQKLVGTIWFGNTSKQIDLESDLSPELTDFNNNKKTPLSLAGQIVEVPTEAGFKASIKDWEKGSSGSGTAI